MYTSESPPLTPELTPWKKKLLQRTTWFVSQVLTYRVDQLKVLNLDQ